MNSSIYSGIIFTLEKQLECVKQLIDLSDQKLFNISENNTNELMKIASKEEKLAREIINLEKNRDNYIKLIEKEKKVKIDNITELVSMTDSDLSEKMKNISFELKNNFYVLQEKNKINQLLLEDILYRIEVINNLIKGDSTTPTYENTKFKKKTYGNIPQESNYFDSKY